MDHVADERACPLHRASRGPPPPLRFATRGRKAGALLATMAASDYSKPRPYGHFTTGGMDERIDSTLPPVFKPNTVPRS